MSGPSLSLRDRTETIRPSATRPASVGAGTQVAGPVRVSGVLAGLAGGVFVKRFGGVAHRGSLAQGHCDGLRVEIDVGDGDE